MKLILFIGHHKVGSSALQTYLARHALTLLRRGILYPAVEPQGFSILLDLALRGQDRSDTPLPVNFREAHNALAFGMLAQGNSERQVPALHEGLPPAADMLRAITRQIEVFEPHTVILAAEVFANFGNLGPHLIDELGACFSGAEIHLAATLRRVDDYLVSWHGQRMRFGQTPRSLPGGALRHYQRGIHFNYRLMLEPWLTRLPGAALRLRPYEQVLAQGGAVQDFLAGFGIDPVPGVPVEPKVNTSLHRGLIEIARQANHTLPREAAAELFRTLLHLGPDLGLPRAAEVEMFGPQARADMAAAFAPVHDWLSGLTGGPFFADAADIAVLRPVHEHAANLAALAALNGPAAARVPGGLRPFLRQLELVPNFALSETAGMNRP